jgi:CRISPR-associated protein Csb2
MPFAIVARLREGRYDAAGIRPGEAEWPPHPARLFCALAASARTTADWAALRWLEGAGRPEVRAAGRVAVTRAGGWVVTNRTESKGNSQFWPGRTNGWRARAGVVPADPEFAVVWPDARPDAATLDALAGLARGVPYLGRSTSPVVLAVSDGTEPPRQGWTRYAPVPLGQRHLAELRVPYPGYADQLRAAYADGRRAWEVARTIPYSVPGPPEPQRSAAGPFGGLLVFGLPAGAGWPGDSLLTLTATLRQALIARIGTGVPAQVSGHGADNRPHVGYLALPDAGHAHARGDVLGVAVALPARMPGAELDLVLAALVDEPLRVLRMRRDRQVKVSYDPFRTAPYGLTEERWTAQGAGGARRWVTVTPLMLDRYPRRGRTVVSETGESLGRAGYPEPVEVEVSPSALTPGAVHRPRPGTIPQGRPRRPLVHARVTFREPVTGPVLAGSMRFLGLGLLAPERDTP